MRLLLHYLLTTIVCIQVLSCKKGQTDTGTITTTSHEIANVLTVSVDNLRLRAKPGEKSDVIATLTKGTQLTDLGEVSDFTTKVILRGVTYDEPWIFVATPDSLKGWVYAGAITFNMTNPSDFAVGIMRKRLQSIFGSELTNRIDLLRLQINQLSRSRELAEALRNSEKLRDTLHRVLDRKLNFSDFDSAPDLFWIKDIMPHYQPQMVAEGTAYYLFHDYRFWQDKAAQTTGTEDDNYLAICLKMFPEDSIEYFYPSWFLQTWDYGGHSLLGRGIHFELLGDIDRLFAANEEMFLPELQKIKNRIVDDITRQETTYWESKEQILAELKKISNAKFSCLSESDQIALATRTKMFENPEDNNIQLDFRSGRNEY